MHTKIERGITGPSITIEGLADMRDKTDSIYESIVEHCCRDLSVNELRVIVRETTAQLTALDTDDIPLSYTAIASEVEVVLRKREGKSQRFSHPVSAKLFKHLADNEPAIEVFGLSGKRTKEPNHIFPTLVEHCSKDLSTNELRQVVLDLELQLATSSEKPADPAYAALLSRARESELIDQLKAVIRNRTGNEPKFSTTMRVKIERQSAGGPTISITGLRSNPTIGGNTMHIFTSIVEHCSKDFSLDELRQILWGLEREFSFRNPDDIPLSYAEMLDEIRAIIRKRRDNHQTAASSK